MTGRPTKLTPETRDRIAQAIQYGATYWMAAQYGGIAYNTFNDWMKRGAAEIERRQSPRVKEGTPQWEAEQPFLEFHEAIKKAEGAGAVGWLLKIEQAATAGNWQAAAWKLERRYPQDYGRRVTEVQGKDGGPVQTEDISLTDDQRAAKLAAIISRAQERKVNADD